MHEVRVYQNRQMGTLWWARDDLGFVGGADRLSDLVDSIRDWAECEGVADELAVRLVATATEDAPRDPVVISVPSQPRVADDN